MFGFQRTSHPDCPDCEQTRLLSLRAAKFDALSVLFGLELSHYVEAIDALLEVCPGVPSCPVRSTGVLEAGRDALAWTRNVGNVGPIHAEHVRLFGGENARDPMPCVAPCGSMYLTGDPAAVGVQLERSYAEAGFAPVCRDTCPSHITNELKFVAHLLGRASEGDDTALEGAHQFLVGHLFTWGILFSAATHARSDHPVTRFAGLMMEHLLFCEIEHAEGLVLSQGTPHPESEYLQSSDMDVQ
ncbi:MAG: molecular chaperone TorD family protein [Coriobacteriia bacterium]|nr:molecular chaperone TorD family protein [Coriobacteriia bacterium]